MQDEQRRRILALERENADLRDCIDELLKQITELSAKYEAPSDAVATQQRALYDVPSNGMTNEMYLKSLTTKQLAKLYARHFFCQHYDPQTGEFEMAHDCPLKDLCVELDQNAPDGTIIECEDVVEHWLKTQYSETSELNIDK